MATIWVSVLSFCKTLCPQQHHSTHHAFRRGPHLSPGFGHCFPHCIAQPQTRCQRHHSFDYQNHKQRKITHTTATRYTRLTNPDQVVTLNTTLNGFQPNILLNGLQALKIQKQTNDIGDSLVDATKVAANSDPLNADDSFTVAAAVLDFQPKIFSLLDNLERHEPVFKKAILGLISVEPLVYKSLQRQKQLSAAFGSTVASRLSEPVSKTHGKRPAA